MSSTVQTTAVALGQTYVWRAVPGLGSGGTCMAGLPPLRSPSVCTDVLGLRLWLAALSALDASFMDSPDSRAHDGLPVFWPRAPAVAGTIR